MISSKVAHIKVSKLNRQGIFEAVWKVMEDAKWENYLKGESVFVKPNCLSDQLVPGQCTSPWVLEAVIIKLKERFSRIYVGDADVATARQVEKCAKNWGFYDICKKQGVNFVNLSKQPVKSVDMEGKIFRKIEMPEILLNVDCIITIPVIKTHNVTTMTCALKNQWGCLPRIRQQYHLVASKAIAELNKFLKVDFAVADATVCLEGNGPRVGTPKSVGSILASNDLVALDCAACTLMGIDAKKVGHIARSEELKVGTAKYKLKGDKIISHDFKPSLIQNHPIVRWEMRIRKMPVISSIIFKTPLFAIPAFFASRYNSIWWYYKTGKRKAAEFVKDNPIYMEEFGDLLRRIGKI